MKKQKLIIHNRQEKPTRDFRYVDYDKDNPSEDMQFFDTQKPEFFSSSLEWDGWIHADEIEVEVEPPPTPELKDLTVYKVKLKQNNKEVYLCWFEKHGRFADGMRTWNKEAVTIIEEKKI